MICPQCRHINEPDAKFCNNCGCPLSFEAVPGLSQPPVYGELVPGIDYGESPDVIDYSKTVPVGGRAGDSLAEDVEYMFGPSRGDETLVDLTGLDRLVDSSNASGAEHAAPSVLTVPIDGTKRMPNVPVPAGAASYRGGGAEPDGTAKKGKGLKTALIVLLVLAALAAGAAAATYYLGMWGGKVVPDVMGEALVNATYRLEDAGFVVDVEERKSDDVEGIVVDMDPHAGARCEEGSTVTVFMSVSRVIPNVIGLERDAAVAAVEAEGFSDVEVVVTKSDEAEGTVVAVDPAPDTKAKSGQHITVTVAEPYTVPSVEGMSEEEAVAAVTEAGYEAQVSIHYAEDLPEGSVYGTEPAAGSKLNSGATVVIYIVKSRAAQCLTFAQNYLASSDNFVIGGRYFQIDKDSINLEYRGDSKVGYTMKGKEYTVVFGQTVFNEAAGLQDLAGTITFNDAGDNVGSDPDLKRA